MAYNTDTTFAGFALNQRIATLRAEFADRMAKRKVYRTTIAELESLSNRDLSDLGLSRAMIKSIALETAYGK